MCSRTLQPHLFIFTAVDVKTGQEVLLDYGEVSKTPLSAHLLCRTGCYHRMHMLVALYNCDDWHMHVCKTSLLMSSLQ